MAVGGILLFVDIQGTLAGSLPGIFLHQEASW
jgi:hypothetical protein